MASTYLSRTNGTPTLSNKFTISVWVKRAELSTSGMNPMCGSDSTGSHATQFYFDGPSLRFFDNYTSTDLVTNRKFRDTNAWYHIVAAIDTSQNTAADRVKIYVNGTQETSFATETYPTQNTGMIFNINGYVKYIGTAENTGGTKFGYFDGCMSHFHFVDGQQYNASVFGSTDATTGEWKINTDPTMTMGNNGFTILKDANTITDQSSNSNNFTLGAGTLTQTEDNPSSNFATFNPLFRHGQTTSGSPDFFLNANTTFYTPSSNDARKGFFVSSLGMSSGKYYCEMKIKAGARLFVGICNANVLKSTSIPYDTTNQSFIGYYPLTGNVKYDNNTDYATSVTAPENTILGFALDCDNNHWYIHKNGTYINSGDPTSGSTGTGSIIGNVTYGSSYFNHGEMFFFAADFSTTGYARAEFNFGNGYFASTAISSEGTNASNIGKFEYNVPTGYTALSTKGLNE